MARQYHTPQTPAVLDGGVILPNEVLGMDPEAFDNNVKAKSVPLIHYRAIRCPVGLVDSSDVRRVHPDHAGCRGGFIYKPIGKVFAALTANQTQMMHLEMGTFDGSTVLATFTRFYDSDPTKRVLVRPYDRFYVDDTSIVTGTWDLTTRRQDDRPDRYEFPALTVEHLIDADAQEYTQSIDFDINADGDIVWRENRGPAPGTVYSVWYIYRPYWLVQRLVHEVRLFPVYDNFVEPDKVRMERLGFGAVLQREYIRRTQSVDEEAPQKTRGNQKLPLDIDDSAV